MSYKSINPDDYLQTPTGRVWTPERNREAWRLAYASLREVLERLQEERPLDSKPVLYVVCGIQGSGKSTWIRENGDRLAPCVFFDAALPRAVHRAPVIEIARAAEVEAKCVWVNVPIAAALERNAHREPDERVPESSIHAVAQQFEQPSTAEGFSEVVVVREAGTTSRDS